MPFTSDKTRQGAAGVSTGYDIEYSCRFNDDDSARLSLVPDSTTNQKTFTFSGWVKRCNLSSGADQEHTIISASNTAGSGGSRYTYLAFDDDECLQVFGGVYSTSSTTRSMWKVTKAVFRDVGAWYHVVWRHDSTDGTPANRDRLYVNGVLQEWNTSRGDDLDAGLNADSFFNVTTSTVGIGQYALTSMEFDGYMAELHFIDGTSVAATSFGESGDYGEWKPKKVAGLTYGDNGFYLDFADSGALGDDESGNTNDYAVTNLVATDQMLDTPTNNFATFNPLNEKSSLTVSYSEGNTKILASSSGGYLSSNVTMASPVGSSTGSYHEVCWTAVYGSASGAIWVGNGISHTAAGVGIYVAYWKDGVVRSYPGNVTRATCTALATGDIVGVAIDDTNVKFYRNNVLQTTLTTGVSDEVYGGGLVYYLNHMVFNAGQDSSFAGAKTAQGNQDANDIGDFYYTPPSGYVALCTANISDPAVIPSEHFNTVLWTGNDTARSITGVGFQPDFIWAKTRSLSTKVHMLIDAVRGGDKNLDSANTTVENSNANREVTFASDGFGILDTGHLNEDAATYVSWNWNAGGTTVTNTAGNEDTQVRANPDAGFSIVGWTNDGDEVGTRGHGLSKAPELIIHKLRSGYAAGWGVWQTGIAITVRVRLDTGAIGTNSHMNDTLPTATVFSVGNPPQFGDDSNDNPMIAYCFHSVDGYSKFGSYSGTSDENGPFLYTGFRPAFAITFPITTADDGFLMHDNKRQVENRVDALLYANTTGAEVDNSGETTTGSRGIDFLSNGIKIRGSNSNFNYTGRDYCFIAFAETPFKYSNAR